MTKAIDYVAEMNKIAVRRLHRAKLRMACYLFAVGGFGRFEQEREGQAPTAEERAAYGQLYSRVARELTDAYRQAFITGTLAQDRTLQRECLEWFYGQRVAIMQALDMDFSLSPYLEADEQDFREQLEAAMRAL